MVKAMSSFNITKKTGANNNSKEPQSMDATELLQLPFDEILRRLNTSQSGLASQEVEKRLEYTATINLQKRKEEQLLFKFFYA
jgi:magnesium-transporting ATPase (P-type)